VDQALGSVNPNDPPRPKAGQASLGFVCGCMSHPQACASSTRLVTQAAPSDGAEEQGATDDAEVYKDKDAHDGRMCPNPLHQAAQRASELEVVEQIEIA